MSSFPFPIWFNCKLCNNSLRTVEQYIEHKKLKHFEEFDKVNNKCFIFEETTGSTGTVPAEWKPQTRTSNCHNHKPDPTSTTHFSNDEFVLPDISSSKIVEDGDPDPDLGNSHFAIQSEEGPLSSDLPEPEPEPSNLFLFSNNSDSDCEADVANDNDCDKNIDPLENVSTIIKSETATDSFQCSVCLRKFKKLYALRLHQKAHKSTEEVQQQEEERDQKQNLSYICRLCGFNFFNKPNLLQHLKIHSKERPFKCSHLNCESAFKTYSALKEHKGTHTDATSFHCLTCKLAFKAEKHLRKHRRISSCGRPFRCTQEKCISGFKTKEELDRHILRLHSRRPHHRCRLDRNCTQSFPDVKLLNEHILKCHGHGHGQSETGITLSSLTHQTQTQTPAGPGYFWLSVVNNSATK